MENFFIKLLMGLVFIGSSFVLADEQDNNKIQVLENTKYDYDAVCDFILARFEEVRVELSDAQNDKITHLRTVQSSQVNPSVELYKYSGKSSEVEFAKVNSKVLISSAKLNYALTHKHKSQEYISARLGIKSLKPQEAIEINCDALSAQLFFNQTELKTVVIKANFTD